MAADGECVAGVAGLTPLIDSMRMAKTRPMLIMVSRAMASQPSLQNRYSPARFRLAPLSRYEHELGEGREKE
jgi:hypothetical protein